MPGTRCIVCRATRVTDPGVSFHRFPANEAVRNTWITNLQLDVDIVARDSRVCSRHFPDGDVTKEPVLTLGKRLASPMKKSHLRAGCTGGVKVGVTDLLDEGETVERCKRKSSLLISLARTLFALR